MKKFFAIVLSMVMAASLFSVVANAEAKNYVTKQWNADMFKGAIEILEDGTAEYTKINNTWYAPTVSILEDLKTMLGDKSEVDVTLTCKVKVRFIPGQEDGETNIQCLMRGEVPDGFFNGCADNDAKDEKFNSQYKESLDGEDPLIQSIGSLLMYKMSRITVYDFEWTEYTTNFTLVKGMLSPDFITEVVMTFDSIKDYDIIDALLVKDFGLYLTEEYEANKPTPEATAEPAMTSAPGATDAPTATDAPAEKKGCGSVLTLGLLAAMIPVAIAARKKETR